MGGLWSLVRRRCGGGALGWSCPVPSRSDTGTNPPLVRMRHECPDVADSPRADAVGVFHWSRGSPLWLRLRRRKGTDGSRTLLCCAVRSEAVGTQHCRWAGAGGGARSNPVASWTAPTVRTRRNVGVDGCALVGLVCEERDEIGGVPRDVSVAFVVAGRRDPTSAPLAFFFFCLCDHFVTARIYFVTSI